MSEKLEPKRIYIFLSIAFGQAWLLSLVVYLTGGLVNSPILISGTPISLALVLIAGPVMWSPAIANVLTRWLTKEGWQDTYLRPQIKKHWRYWVTAWFGPGILTLLGLILFFLLFPKYYDPNLTQLKTLLDASLASSGQTIDINIWIIVAAQVMQAFLLAPLINGFFIFGEEFGWRAYLQPKLMPLGGRRAMLWMGLIWGVWHWPIILMGHNYGLDYLGAPFLGPLAMVWFTLTLGILFGWVTLKANSVWPAVIGHGAINGIASLGSLFTQGEPNSLIGPLPTGFLGGLGLAIIALIIFASPRGLVAAKARESETIA